jgi:hypothetical protein
MGKLFANTRRTPRAEITGDDIYAAIKEIRDGMCDHIRDYGSGVFFSPQEIVGCMVGQLRKLSMASDEELYTGDLADFRQRCLKTINAMVMGLISVDKLPETADAS